MSHSGDEEANIVAVASPCDVSAADTNSESIGLATASATRVLRFEQFNTFVQDNPDSVWLLPDSLRSIEWWSRHEILRPVAEQFRRMARLGQVFDLRFCDLIARLAKDANDMRLRPVDLIVDETEDSAANAAQHLENNHLTDLEQSAQDVVGDPFAQLATALKRCWQKYVRSWYLFGSTPGTSGPFDRQRQIIAGILPVHLALNRSGRSGIRTTEIHIKLAIARLKDRAQQRERALRMDPDCRGILGKGFDSVGVPKFKSSARRRWLERQAAKLRSDGSVSLGPWIRRDASTGGASVNPSEFPRDWEAIEWASPELSAWVDIERIRRTKLFLKKLSLESSQFLRPTHQIVPRLWTSPPDLSDLLKLDLGDILLPPADKKFVILRLPDLHALSFLSCLPQPNGSLLRERYGVPDHFIARLAADVFENPLSEILNGENRARYLTETTRLIHGAALMINFRNAGSFMDPRGLAADGYWEGRLNRLYRIFPNLEQSSFCAWRPQFPAYPHLTVLSRFGSGLVLGEIGLLQDRVLRWSASGDALLSNLAVNLVDNGCDVVAANGNAIIIAFSPAERDGRALLQRIKLFARQFLGNVVDTGFGLPECDVKVSVADDLSALAEHGA
jgi:hypothetical protein